MLRQFELVERVKAYDPKADEDLLNKAYVYAMRAHGNQKRASGDPYFSHPLEVAGILTRWRLDSASIATALLHDTVEDTGVTLEDITKNFGEDIAFLVDGVTKLSKISYTDDQKVDKSLKPKKEEVRKLSQAENFRKLVLAMSKDLRVLLVKLADRLHNMRTLNFIKDPKKRHRIARETLEIYAPLAERIGMQEMRNELADIAFSELHPEAYASIEDRLRELRETDAPLVGQIIHTLKHVLDEAGIRAQVSGREKSPYSIWKKMQLKNISFEQLSDIMAFRVLVDTDNQCYQALGAIHSAFPNIPARVKDYISTPKPNRYKSIHTTVFGPNNQRLEIQIRTHEMHAIAEMGVAAHWQYKEGAFKNPLDVSPSQNPEDFDQYRWLRSMLEILENSQDPEEFLENTKLEMFSDRVFCFTPRGDLISLPKGACPVDFAYAIHSDTGDQCVGVKINGRLMPLRSVLKTGDHVEILTAKGHVPPPTWERFVVSGKAKARIRRYIEEAEREKNIATGRTKLTKGLRKIALQEEDVLASFLRKNPSFLSSAQVYEAIGAGRLSLKDLTGVPEEPNPSLEKEISKKNKKTSKTQTPHSPVEGVASGLAIHFGACCHPLPGDSIVGRVLSGKSVRIHRQDCSSLSTPQVTGGEVGLLDLDWVPNHSGPFIGRINVLLQNVPGALGKLTSALGQNGANINNLKMVRRSPDFFEILVDVEIPSAERLSEVMAALLATKTVQAVERV